MRTGKGKAGDDQPGAGSWGKAWHHDPPGYGDDDDPAAGDGPGGWVTTIRTTTWTDDLDRGGDGSTLATITVPGGDDDLDHGDHGDRVTGGRVTSWRRVGPDRG